MVHKRRGEISQIKMFNPTLKTNKTYIWTYSLYEL